MGKESPRYDLLRPCYKRVPGRVMHQTLVFHTTLFYGFAVQQSPRVAGWVSISYGSRISGSIIWRLQSRDTMLDVPR